MAHLLGHRGCMQSLRADLRDLQAAIADVSSRAGPVRIPSWKFPDKLACDLDMAELLERYDYTEQDPEFTQHSHVVLLELMIDRLLLLLESFTGYTENLLSERGVPPAQAAGPSMSAGLTARRYWSSMLKLGGFCQQLLAEKKALKKELPPLQPAPRAGSAEKQLLEDTLPDVLELTCQEVAPSKSRFPPLSVRGPGSDTSGSSLPRAARSTAESRRSIPKEPTGTSPGPCATCAMAQAGLHQVGRAITSICQSQNIPSALSKFQAAEETRGRRTLSATDLGYWASEQSKDLSRIDKHLRALVQRVSPLKTELAQTEKQKEELRKRVEDLSRLLQVERESQAQRSRAAEQILEAQSKEHSAAVARLERDKSDLQRGAALLEEQVCTLKEELAAQKAAVQELEVSRRTLLEEVRTTMVARKEVLELEEKVQLLTGQRDSLGQELDTATIEMQKEKAMVESMQRHQESLQAKQKVLLQQLDSLDQERRELQSSLGEAQEGTAKLAEQLEESQQQLRVQQELLDTLQQEKLSLEQSVPELQDKVSKLEKQAQELRERERLLVFFPELHGPPETQLESTGSLSEDMENQLRANSIRIQVLEQENARLGSALAKLRVAAQRGMLKLVPQSQLWCQLPSGQDARDMRVSGQSCPRESPRARPGTASRARLSPWH